MTVVAAALTIAWGRTAPPLFEGVRTYGHYTHKTSLTFAGRYQCWKVPHGLECPSTFCLQGTLENYHRPDPPQVLYRPFLLRALAALIKEFFVLLQALFQISPCTFYNRVSYITLPPHPLHRTKNRLHARVTTGIRPGGGHSHESYKGPSWRTGR